MRKEDGAKAAAASVYSSTGRISRQAWLIYAPAGPVHLYIFLRRRHKEIVAVCVCCDRSRAVYA
jgi:hypothetical protein